jgi:hypothetical protein
MVLRLRVSPMTLDDLTGWVRVRCPRILPEAIGAHLLKLSRSGLVRCDESQWRSCELPTLHLWGPR